MEALSGLNYKPQPRTRTNTFQTYKRLRWDKGDVSSYYNSTFELMSYWNCLIDRDPSQAPLHCADYVHDINQHYELIVNTLRDAGRRSIPSFTCNAAKPFWNDYLNELKQKSIFWHSLWRDAGSPATGLLQRLKSSCRFKYKLAIKTELLNYENSYNDDLLTHFTNKELPEFWKCWSKKTGTNVEKEVYFNGSNDHSHVASVFADHFKSVYSGSVSSFDARSEYLNRLNSDTQLITNDDIMSLINVEVIDKCISKLNHNKAAGPDELTAEHLFHAHPVVILHLCRLFRKIAAYRFVPDSFGRGHIIPLLKDKAGDVNDLNNYRGITLIPVISKLFESVLLAICSEFLSTDDLQFGFKKGLGCADAIFLFQETVSYFLSRGSTVYAASLDVKKAFDTVNHFKLYFSLLKAKVPK